MKVLKLLVAVSVLASSAFAQKPGVFVSAGGGVAQMNIGRFIVYNPLASTPGGEPLEVIDKKSTVSVARMTVGYNFTENWALQVSYVNYGTGEAKVATPQYTGITFATYYNAYTRHVLKYKPSALTLMPSFTYAVGEKSRIIVGAGICSSKTSSHFETTVRQRLFSDAEVDPLLALPPSATSIRYTEQTTKSLGYIVSFGFDFLIAKGASIQMTGNYTTLSAKVPSVPWSLRSKSSVRLDSLSAELSLAWHF